MSLKCLSVICTHPLVLSWKPSLLRGWQLTLTSTGETFLDPTLSVWDCGSFITIILQVLEAKTGTSMEESDGWKTEQKWNPLTFSPTNVIFWNFKPKRYPLKFQARMWSSGISSKNVIISNCKQKWNHLKFLPKRWFSEISNKNAIPWNFKPDKRTQSWCKESNYMCLFHLISFQHINKPAVEKLSFSF